MDDKPQYKPETPRKRKVEIDLRDLFAENKDPKGGSSAQKPESPSQPETNGDKTPKS